MKSHLLVLLSILAVSSLARSESIAQNSFSYMIDRYRATKYMAPDKDCEVSLACSGEILTEYVMAYSAAVDGQNLNKSLIPNYQKAIDLVQAHLADTENVYPKLRENLVAAIKATLAAKRAAGALASVPTDMTIQNYGESQMLNDFAVCDDPSFIQVVAQLAPLTGSYNDEIKGSYQIPIGKDDGNRAVDDGIQEKTVIGKRPIKSWLYDISIR